MAFDKHKAMIDYLSGYAPLAKYFYAFSIAKKKNKTIVPMSSPRVLKTYIDGSVLRRYDFAIVSFEEFDEMMKSKANVGALMDADGFIEWITEQNRLRNYPNFGDECEVESVEALQDMNDVMNTDEKNLAKYMVQCRVTYIDTSNT